MENADRLAETETLDNGQPINESKYIAIPATIDVLEFYAGLANKVQGETLSSPGNRFNYTLREQLGVIEQRGIELVSTLKKIEGCGIANPSCHIENTFHQRGES